MDILAHAVYGATVCSRTGLGGGRQGGGQPWWRDRTIWLALGFGVLPDAVSMGPSFVAYCMAGMPDNFFHQFGGNGITLYRCMHSLVIGLAAVAILRVARKGLALPALAWPLHVAMDAVTHADGKFGTTVLYPFSTWMFPGVRWWEHPGVVWGYWLALTPIWMGLMVWRRGGRVIGGR
ncbi:MAG: hypothetical protein K8T26_00610 [Lentisphaerae bacterium]|nr:hypothetical protein [Lentisphaerota bacterium]